MSEVSPSPMPGLATRRELWLMLALLGLIALLALLGRSLPTLATPMVVLVWTLFWIPLMALMFWRRRLARRAWLQVYLNDHSPWRTRLRGGPLMLLGQAAVSGLLALSLVVALARGVAPATWIVLVVSVPFWVKSWNGLGGYLARHAGSEVLPLVTGRLLVRLFGVVLLAGLATWGLWQPVADLGQSTLHEAVRHFAARYPAESTLLERLLSLTAVLDGLRLWLLQHWLEGLPGMGLRLLAWLVVLAREWLFLWPWLLLCQALSHVLCAHDEHPARSGA